MEVGLGAEGDSPGAPGTIRGGETEERGGSCLRLVLPGSSGTSPRRGWCQRRQQPPEPGGLRWLCWVSSATGQLGGTGEPPPFTPALLRGQSPAPGDPAQRPEPVPLCLIR